MQRRAAGKGRFRSIETTPASPNDRTCRPARVASRLGPAIAVWRWAMPSMKLDAVTVTSSNLATTAKFYTLLGFQFPEFKADAKHLEPITAAGEVRLMIDEKALIGDQTTPAERVAAGGQVAAVGFEGAGIGELPDRFSALDMAYRSFREVLAGSIPASIRRPQSNVVTQIPA
jgi:hypothetical protein